MKIGYFITHFPYDYIVESKNYHCGGAENAAYCLALEMSKKCELEIFTTSVSSKDSIETYKNMVTRRYGTNFKILTSNISLGMFTKPIKHDVDIAHTHFDIAPGPLAGFIYAKKKRVPLVITYHGDWAENYGGVIRRLGVGLQNKYMVNKILSRADVIISPSEHYINESIFLKNYINKIVVIPNGINLDDFDISYSKEECRNKLFLPIDKKIILFLGYLSPYKGPDVLLKSMKIVLEETDAILVLAGKGTMINELKMLSKKLGIEKNVIFAGYVDNGLKPIYYKSADIFVLPSTMSTESFGIVNLEAMACSIPIVASNIGGIPDVVKNGENGLLVPPRDYEALASAVNKLLTNETLAEKLGKKGREFVEKYSWRRVANMTEEIYKDLVTL